MPAVSSSLIFPSNLQNYSFWISFRFYQYNISLVSGSTGNTANLTDLNTTIRLPLPNSMIDHQDQVYSVEDLGLVAGSALARLNQGIGAAAGGAATGILANGGSNVVNKIGEALGSQNAAGAILATQGLAVNPFLSVMFKSPAFKKHAFKWKLSPVNQTESGTMNNIINTFRFNQLPSASAAFGGTMLAYPNICIPTISYAQTPANGILGNTFTYYFQPCVIESFAVNFAPNGQAAMFADTAAPTETEISLSLLELQYAIQNDWGTPTTLGSNNTLGSTNPLGALGNLGLVPPNNQPTVSDPTNVFGGT